MGTLGELLFGVAIWGAVFLLYVLSERQMTSRFDLDDEANDVETGYGERRVGNI